jgi:ubiquinone/menaquinone biosynthesis C-methylase UbiE
VLHHLSDKEVDLVLDEVGRVLKPGGLFLVMEDTKNKNPLTSLLHYFDQGEFIRTKERWQGLLDKEWSVLDNWTFNNTICFYSSYLLKDRYPDV